jgi:hypothetical protein
MKNRMMNWQHRLDATLREMTRLKMGGWLGTQPDTTQRVSHDQKRMESQQVLRTARKGLLPQARGQVPFTG